MDFWFCCYTFQFSFNLVVLFILFFTLFKYGNIFFGNRFTVLFYSKTNLCFFYQFQLSRVRKELNLVKPIFSAILFDLLQNAVDKLIRERRAKNIQDPKTFPHKQSEVKKSRQKTFTEYQLHTYLGGIQQLGMWTNLYQILTPPPLEWTSLDILHTT